MDKEDGKIKNMNKVNFQIKCWEGDYKILLNSDRIKKTIDNCSYQFNEKILLLNNINDMSDAIKLTDVLIKNNVIDKYIIVSEYGKIALDFFNIDINSFNGNGYYYSISELVGVYLCDVEYLLFFSSDSYMDKSYDFITPSINIFKTNSNVIVSNPIWNNDFSSAKREAIFGEDDEFFYGYGFSDQCYLLKVNEFKNKIYNEHHPISERYPIYGGNAFEKRVDSYMRNHQKLRITNKHCSYIHKNF